MTTRSAKRTFSLIDLRINFYFGTNFICKYNTDTHNGHAGNRMASISLGLFLEVTISSIFFWLRVMDEQANISNKGKLITNIQYLSYSHEIVKKSIKHFRIKLN